MDLSNITSRILQKIPQPLIPSSTDGILLHQYKDFFKKHEDTVITNFYNIIYSEPHLQAHMTGQTRPNRENTLRQWYQVTTSGYFDEHYWSWQVLVGIIHVKHDIPNPAVLGMWSWMVNFLQERLLEELPVNEALDVIQVLQKLQATVCSLIIEGFILTQQEAISRASGINQKILNRFVHIEIDQLLAQGRTLLQANMQQQTAT